MKWTVGIPVDVGFYLFDCRPYKDVDTSWNITAFFRGDSLVIFDPRGISHNIEIPLEDVNIHAWIGPLDIPTRA